MGYFYEIYHSGLPHRAVAVYMYLKDRADKDGKCFPAIGTIARELKLSKSTVKRAIQDLEQAGYLETKQRWRENGGRSSLEFHLKREIRQKGRSP
jgi:DNA-binding MarR family transcriptional regulator